MSYLLQVFPRYLWEETLFQFLIHQIVLKHPLPYWRQRLRLYEVLLLGVVLSFIVGKEISFCRKTEEEETVEQGNWPGQDDQAWLPSSQESSSLAF